VAREILLRLRTKNYERAEKLAKRIAERAKATLRTAKGLTQELREGVRQAQAQAELRRRGAALGARGARAAGRDLQAAQRQAFGQRLGGLAEAREKGETLKNLALTAQEGGLRALPALLSAAQFVPGLGPLAALVTPVAEAVLSKLEERFEQELKQQEARLTARLEEERFRRDYTRQLEEDPSFRRQEARRAFELTLAEEARRGPRIQRSTADLLSDLEL